MKRKLTILIAILWARLCAIKDNTLLAIIIVHVIAYSVLGLVAYDAHRHHSKAITTLEKQQRHTTERISTIDEIAKLARREAGQTKKQLDRSNTTNR